MDFSHLGHDPRFLAPDGSIVTYETMASISNASSPRHDYDYSLMASGPIPMASPYVLAGPGMQHRLTPDPSPVDRVQIEFADLAAPYPEDRSYKPRKQDGKSQTSTSMHMRRKAQNRASQRAFRERKEKHTQDLQRRLSEVEQQLDSMKQQFERCQREKGQLELQVGRCSCSAHDEWATGSEDGSLLTAPSLSGSVGGSVDGSRTTSVGPEGTDLTDSARPSTGAIQSLDGAYWTTQQH